MSSSITILSLHYLPLTSEHLAGGNYLNVGCVTSETLIKYAKVSAQMRRVHNYWITSTGPIKLNFTVIMSNMRTLCSKIPPLDRHNGTNTVGTQVFQGWVIFTRPNTLEVTNSQNNISTLKFFKGVIAIGGGSFVLNIMGLSEALSTTNTNLFNLKTLPLWMVILAASVIALEMVQTFAWL